MPAATAAIAVAAAARHIQKEHKVTLGEFKGHWVHEEMLLEKRLAREGPEDFNSSSGITINVSIGSMGSIIDSSIGINLNTVAAVAAPVLMAM